MADEPIASADARRDALFQARRRGVLALVGTGLVCAAAYYFYHDTVELPGTRDCKTTSECDGVIGVECLHAPTGNYCTHTCSRDEDCDPTFHCDSPPWETGTTRLICLREVPPAKP